MTKTKKSLMQFSSQPSETLSIKRLERILNAENAQPRLVGSNGEEILLPESVYTALQQVIQAMASGQSITIVPQDREMTTQQAADFLNISRPYLIKLLEQGEIPYSKVGSHRRVASKELIAYKAQRNAERRQHLSNLTSFLEEEGFYDKDISNLDR
jgi:excisionase family DNA binding protein